MSEQYSTQALIGGRFNQHIILPEVTMPDGRRIDYMAIGRWPSTGYKIIAFEEKKSISDFMREIRSPEKSERAYQMCHQFYLVAPREAVKEDLIPSNWGWLRRTAKTLRLEKRAHGKELGDLPYCLSGVLLNKLDLIRGDRLHDITDRARRDAYERGVKKGKESKTVKVFDEEKGQRLAMYERISAPGTTRGEISGWDHLTLFDALRAYQDKNDQQRVARAFDMVKRDIKGIHSSLEEILERIEKNEIKEN